MKRIITIIFLITTTAITSLAQTSPNGKVKAEYVSACQVSEIQVSYKGAHGWQCVMKMPVKLDCENIANISKAKEVAYDMASGKKKHCTNALRKAYYPLPDGHQLWIKAYNDGIAWYTSCTKEPDDKDFDGYHVDFSSAKNNWIMQWTDSYEGFFPKNREVKDGTRYGYPALFEFDDNVFALLSESNIKRDCAASSFYATSNPKQFVIRRDGKEMDGEQTLIIGSLADIVESTLITDNSEPVRSDLFPLTEQGVPEWVQPGVAAWVYWAYNHGSNDFSIIKKYVDMAVALKLPYVLIDAEWDEMDKVASNDGKTIEDAVRYATDRGVKPIIWYNSSVGWVNGAPGPKYRLNKPEDREKEFSWCESIGVKGVKIDFFSGDTNRNISYMIDLLECAARHHLLVNFHGATIPRGLQRTYPNLISTEGVYGEEWYNNVATFTDKAACHNATLPFTRNVVGSMDYTPCAFTDSQHPHITTDAHELALTALYESGIQHLADRPESFLSQPQEVKDYLSGLPTAWDETKLVGGYPGEYAILARRKGSTWYIAGINGTDHAKSVDINVSRLKIKGRNVRLFEDGDKGSGNWKITDSSKIPSQLSLQPRGGFVIIVRK